MEGVVLLSGEFPDLSVGELNGALKALNSRIVVHMDERPLIILSGPPPSGLAERLGFCHFTGTVSITTDPDTDSILDGVTNLLKDHPPDRSISFRVKSMSSSRNLRSGQIFGKIEEMIGSGRWSMRHRHPDMKFFVTVDDRARIGWIAGETGRSSMLGRRGSRMPFNRPIVMDPRLARAMINLSGLPPGSTILDPFMGPGGLIIEGAELGLKGIGIERDPVIFEGGLKNIKETGHDSSIRAYHGDSRMIGATPGLPDISGIDGIVTDPPFGRSAGTMGIDPGQLLDDVIGAAGAHLKKGAPLVLDTGNRDILDDIRGFDLISIYSVRIHKSLTRYVAVLGRS